jgi:hypothetical protein
MRLPGTNAPVYLASSSVTKKKKFNGIDTRMKSRFDLFQSAYMSVSPSKDHLNELVPILKKLFSSSLTAAQNKLVCFSLASFFQTSLISGVG